MTVAIWLNARNSHRKLKPRLRVDSVREHDHNWLVHFVSERELELFSPHSLTKPNSVRYGRGQGAMRGSGARPLQIPG